MLAYFLIIFAATLRLVPHPANFTPITAIGLFGGATLNKKSGFILPLVSLIASDIFIGFDSWASRLSVYGSFLIITLLGAAVLKRKTWPRIMGAAVLGSVIFYLITNLVILYPPVMYAHTWAGQIDSYINALPFLRNMMLGDLVYTSALFGVYAWATRRAKISLKTA